MKPDQYCVVFIKFRNGVQLTSMIETDEEFKKFQEWNMKSDKKDIELVKFQILDVYIK